MDQPRALILCVDDEENPLKLRKLVLQKSGYEVIAANSAKQALEILAFRKVDLVLTDQLMPGITGTELAQRVKSKHPDLPVVIVSGVNELPPDSEIADLFVSKLEGPAYLCQKISDVLTHSQRSQ